MLLLILKLTIYILSVGSVLYGDDKDMCLLMVSLNCKLDITALFSNSSTTVKYVCKSLGDFILFHDYKCNSYILIVPNLTKT